jgi:hypothetical protein
MKYRISAGVLSENTGSNIGMDMENHVRMDLLERCGWETGGSEWG